MDKYVESHTFFNMVIGISGDIGSGKDEAGRIITESLKGYEIKKFASALKEVVSLLVGCNVSLLEDRDFKNRPLGSEWDKWRLVGKDFANAQGLNSSFYSVDYFSTGKEAKDVAKASGMISYAIEKVSMTPRLMMQLLGTEVGRDLFHPNIWVNALFKDYTSSSKWVITDVRFPNEKVAVENYGGMTIHIVRPCVSCHGLGFHKMDCGRVDEHISEHSLDDVCFDKVIFNTGDLDYLKYEVLSALD